MKKWMNEEKKRKERMVLVLNKYESNNNESTEYKIFKKCFFPTYLYSKEQKKYLHNLVKRFLVQDLKRTLNIVPRLYNFL